MTSLATPIGAVAAPSERKLIDLAVIKKGARDYLSFLDETKELLFGYLYHRTGSMKTAHALLTDVYIDLLKRALAPWWFGALTLRLLIRHADRMIENAHAESDIDAVYLPTLQWLSPEERASVGLLHEALWTLSQDDQRILIFAYMLGLPVERIAQIFAVNESIIEAQLEKSRTALLSRWQPVGSLQTSLMSLVFVPAMDIARETSLRLAVVEKYNALRTRVYEWVLAGGLIAIAANFIVAGVIAFVVVIQPSTSLQSVRRQVAGMDALLLQREMQRADADRQLGTILRESQGIAARDGITKITDVGASAVRDALRREEDKRTQIDTWLKALERANVALRTIIEPIRLALKWAAWGRL